MTAQDLLATCEALGVALVADGATLHVEAPADVWTADLRAALAEHKPAIIAALGQRGEKSTSAAAGNDTSRPSTGAVELAQPAPWADPRPDLAEDGDLWRTLLFGAYVGGHDPDSVFWTLQGFRCMGASLRMGRKTLILQRGEIDPAEYASWKAQYLEPNAAELKNLLAEQQSAKSA